MLRNILLLAFAITSTKGEQLLEPCDVSDTECLKIAMDSFLSKTYNGISEWDVKQIDPYFLPSYRFEDFTRLGVTFHLTNVTVTGMKNIKLLDIKLDFNKQSVMLEVKADIIRTVGDVEILLLNEKRFNGDYTTVGSLTATLEYPVTLKMINDTKYLEVGPETIKCALFSTPIVTLGAELQSTLDKDSDVNSIKAEWGRGQFVINQMASTLCHLAYPGFKNLIHNIKAVAKIIPANAFFKNV